MRYSFENPENNEWIDKYNKLCHSGTTKRDNINTSLHHIIPRSISPELTNDKNNHTYLSVIDHMWVHYYLWKANPKYASQAWFGTVWARKNHVWDLPGGDKEYEQLKEDVFKNRRKNRQYISRLHKLNER